MKIDVFIEKVSSFLPIFNGVINIFSNKLT